MILRDFSVVINQAVKEFPAILITGARQVGKTTLVKDCLKKSHQYVLLEDPDVRELAVNDPRAFFKKYHPPLIIDEFQYAPELLSYLQGIIDDNRKLKGQFVLTGSQNFKMMEKISQSLAGRVGIFPLFGLSSLELLRFGKNQNINLFSKKEMIADLILRGTYPELWDQPQISTRNWMASYVQTFLERDLRLLTHVGDLHSFEKFIRALALRCGQVLNVSDLASDCGVSSPTATKWISVLERAYIIKLVYPFSANLSTRIKKAPKIYFLDTGLASFLMGFREASALTQAPQFGALFENLVYADFIKRNANLGEIPSHYYLQTKSKVGVDFIIEENARLKLFEIKLSETFQNKLAEQLVLTADALSPRKSSLHLLMLLNEGMETTVSKKSIRILKWNEM